MKYLNKVFIFVAALFFAGGAFAQSTIDLRFNEMLIHNVNNYNDEYGRCVPWIEIFNTAYNTVNIGGCYMTDDTTGLASVGKKGGVIPAHWYRIPKTDANTAMGQRTYLVFFMDAQPLYGTFHTNFDPRTSKTNYIALITSDGKQLIDLITYPESLKSDSLHSFGLAQDGITGAAKMLEHFTPGCSNETVIKISKQEKLKKDDPYGIGLALISMSVVFTALILIFIMLKIFGHVATKSQNKATDKKADGFLSVPTGSNKPADMETIAAIAMALEKSLGGNASDEEIAAIAMALYLHLDSVHDEESEVVTIENPSAHYSPWSQKSLIMRRIPRLK